MILNGFRFLSTGIAVLFLPAVVQAHEFWIEPHDFTLNGDEALVADIKVGQKLQGDDYSFLPGRFERFELIQGEVSTPVKSRTGDRPAVNETELADGLLVLAYESTPRFLRYSQAEKFRNFVTKEGIAWVLERHEQRGLPEKGFIENYRRFGKSLIKSGAGKGEDKALGLLVELVMLSNPYTDKSDQLTTQLLWQGKPLPNAQVSAFFRPVSQPDGPVERKTYQTDQEGKVTVSRPAEPGMMLLSAVHMIEPDKKTLLKTGALWESLWASTTFAFE